MNITSERFVVAVYLKPGQTSGELAATLGTSLDVFSRRSGKWLRDAGDLVSVVWSDGYAIYQPSMKDISAWEALKLLRERLPPRRVR